MIKERKKAYWRAGKEMPAFSGKSWKELEDIWPKGQRLSSEAMFIVGVFSPAWLATQNFMKANYGFTLTPHDFFLLCWIHRCQEGREGVFTTAWPVMKGINVGGKLWVLKKSKITKLGLIENMPSHHLRLYRVTGPGKLLIQKFISNVEEAHKDMRRWLADFGPQGDEANERITRFMKESVQNE